MPTSPRSKRWTITLNNYTEEEEQSLRSLVSSEDHPVTYLIYGHEVGEQGTPHLQMYLETGKKLARSSIQRMPGLSRASIMVSRGSQKENQDYCRKEQDNIYEEGNPMRQGQRKDLEEIKEDIEKGVSEREIAELHFSQWVVYRRSFSAYRQLILETPRTWITQVHILWGDTGTGKTRFCWDQIGSRTVWMPGDYQWFDGYCGQEIVIIDDFRGEYPIQLALKLFDRYPMRVPIKGGFVNWNPKKIYITSNRNPDYWWPEAETSSLRAFKRRITNVEEIRAPIYEDINVY